MIRRRKKAMHFARLFSASLALILIAAGCGKQAPPDTRAADEATIRDLDAQWSKTAGTRDVDRTVSYYSDDASLLPPNAPIALDKPSIRAVWAELLAADTSLSWQTNKFDVARSGDLAYVTGVYLMTAKDAHGKPTSDHGKFLEVWKKQADGKWKVVADIFNSDVAVQPPPPPAKPKTARTSKHHKKAHSKSHAHRAT
ncbi:MAG: YybH family protein [Candidatus Acidiferrales bacterium]